MTNMRLILLFFFSVLEYTAALARCLASPRGPYFTVCTQILMCCRIIQLGSRVNLGHNYRSFKNAENKKISPKKQAFWFYGKKEKIWKNRLGIKSFKKDIHEHFFL